MQDQASRPADARPSSLSRVTVVLYLFDIALTLAVPAMLMLAVFLYRGLPQTLPRHLRAIMVTNWLQMLEPVIVRLGWLRLLLTFAANCTFVVWLYLAYRKLARSGARTEYRPHWAITGFIVPVLNFVRPYQVVRDAWRAATWMGQQEKTRVTPTPLRIKLWWALVLIVGAINSMAGKAMAPGLRELTPMAVAAYIGGAALSTFFIVVIALIEGELGRLRSAGAARVTLLGRWPLPAVAIVSVVLLAALITLGFYGYAKNGTDRFSAEAFAEDSREARTAAREPAPDMSGGVVGGVPRGVPNHQRGGVVGGVVGGVEGTTVSPPPKAQRIRVSGNVQAARLVKTVQPVYPSLAKQARISGTVTLHAIISTDGRVLSLEVLSGHPMLTQAAMDAVRQWEYQPTLLNGEPVEVDTTIEVVFTLNQK